MSQEIRFNKVQMMNAANIFKVEPRIEAIKPDTLTNTMIATTVGCKIGASQFSNVVIKLCK